MRHLALANRGCHLQSCIYSDWRVYFGAPIFGKESGVLEHTHRLILMELVSYVIWVFVFYFILLLSVVKWLVERDLTPSRGLPHA